jgi:hypothetical protein
MVALHSAARCSRRGAGSRARRSPRRCAPRSRFAEAAEHQRRRPVLQRRLLEVLDAVQARRDQSPSRPSRARSRSSGLRRGWRAAVGIVDEDREGGEATSQNAMPGSALPHARAARPPRRSRRAPAAARRTRGPRRGA